MQHHALLFHENHQFPKTDRGQPFLIDRVLKRDCSPRSYFSWFEDTPNPNVSIKKQFHELRTSQSSSSFAGEMMSPTIRPVPSMDPIHCFFFGFAVGGTTSATGSPNRVTRIGFRVLPTRSKTPRHVGLKFEIPIFFIAAYFSLHATSI